MDSQWIDNHEQHMANLVELHASLVEDVRTGVLCAFYNPQTGGVLYRPTRLVRASWLVFAIPAHTLKNHLEEKRLAEREAWADLALDAPRSHYDPVPCLEPDPVLSV